MSSLRAVTIGTGAGTVVGIFSLAIAYAGLSINSANAVLPTAVILSAIMGSAAAGFSGLILRSLLTGLERSAATALISLAVAALIILPGNYANSSLLPAAVYAMAFMNGLIVGRAIGPLCPQPSSSGRYFLS